MNRVIHASTGAAYSGAAASAVSSILSFFTPGEWQIVGIIAAIIFAAITCISNIYFQHRRLKREEERDRRSLRNDK